MRLRIATWNINSVRLRFGLVERFIAEYQPDILCLQETKCRDDLFPREAFAALGFAHHEIRGQSGYNGVATLSRLPMARLDDQSFCGTDAARHLGVVITPKDGGRPFALHNIYVPAGGDVPDPETNPKFAQKLTYLNALAGWCRPMSGGMPSILTGDFNVAPLETDVWSHRQLLNVVSHTPVEVEHLTAVQRAGGWMDLVRRFVPAEQKLYSWWSYRARDWAASDRGRRLDHIWSSACMAGTASGAQVVKDARGWPQPSDHAPVVADFMIPE